MLGALGEESAAGGSGLQRLLSRVRYALPEGRPLPDDVWRRRHRVILGLLWLHAVVIACFALVAGYGPVHAVVEAGVVAGSALLAGWRRPGRRFRAAVASLGLLSASAILVHLSGGLIEMHFHFFVMVGLITLYQDWTPFLVAIGYVALHHGVVGMLDPHAVYNHPDAWTNPWKWAAIHGAFVMAASIAGIVNWRLNEAARAHVEVILNSAGDGIYGLDLQGNTVFLNPAAARMSGWDAHEAIGRPMHALLHHSRPDGSPYPVDECPIHAPGKDRRAQGAVEEVFWRRDGTSFPVECVSAPLQERGEIAGVVVTFQDVTEHRRLEEELRQAQKMEAIGQLAGGVAHDFNNLLTAINGYSELLLGQLARAHPLRGRVEEIAKAGDRAAALTRQLLAFSRRQVLAPEILDLNAILLDTDQMLRRLIGEDIELVTVPRLALGRVKADPGQIQQVILNLAVNARDAMPQGGRLTIETANTQLAVPLPHSHRVVPPGDYAIIAVHDTGCGMDAATQARIFEPFFTTKERGKGTGLGLATVYGVVSQSGGYITVSSRPGQGTTFRVYLPCVEEAVGAPELPPRPAALPRGTETILLVEDDEPVRFLAHTMLEESGYVVLEASSGAEALRIAEAHAGPIHLLLTDVVMRGMSGPDLAERLSEARPSIQVLYMSGYTDHPVLRDGVWSLSSVLVQKPFTAEALLRKLRQVLDAAGKAPAAAAGARSAT